MCDCPDDEIEVVRAHSWSGGGDFRCHACGHQWIVSQADIEALEERLLHPPLRTLDDIEDEDAKIHAAA